MFGSESLYTYRTFSTHVSDRSRGAAAYSGLADSRKNYSDGAIYLS